MKTSHILRKIFLIHILAGFVLFGSCEKDKEDIKTQIDKDLLLQLVNSYRIAGCNCGSEGDFAPTTPLMWNNLLELTAQDHSEDMFKKNFFSHTGSDGSTLGVRVGRRGYDWQTCGENIAKGHKTEQDVIAGWINSPGHCKNIMNSNFKEMGVFKSGDYWTQVLGTRK